ncbi:MAG: ABC transporter permease [Acidobacteriia bacterium]|nr:ABC transporter permease [Terriglobia bacterium]
MSWLLELKARILAFFRSGAMDRDREEEMRNHLDEAMRRNMARGMPEHEAQRQALLAFGGVENMKEMCRDERGTRLFEDLLRDLRYGLNQMGRNPGFTAGAVLTLALGIGANTAIFTVINAVLLRPLPYQNPERLVTLLESNPQQGMDRAAVSPPNFVDWSTQSRTLEHIAAYRYWGFVLAGGGEPERIIGARVSAGLFTLLGVKPIRGRTFHLEEDRFGGSPVALVREGLWRRRFGADPSLIGKSLTLNGGSYTVVGILPSELKLPDAEVCVPLAFEPYAMTQRGSRALTVLAGLKPDVTLVQARAEMHTIARRLQQQYPDSNAGWDVTLFPLHEEMVARIRPALLVLGAAVAFVLLIACANVANLLLARATSREQEIAVRSALGASRSRLIRQLLTESVLIALLGGALGLLLAQQGTELLVTLGAAGLPRTAQIGIDRYVLGFTLLLSLVTGLGFGLVPAWHASRPGLNQSLREGRGRATGSARHALLRNAVVVCEVALALIVLIGAGLLVRSFVGLLAIEPGFTTAHVLTMTISLPESKYPEGHQKVVFFQQLLQRVDTLPGVTSAGLVSHLPLAGRGLNTDFTIEGRSLPLSGPSPLADYVSVSPDYFRAMQIPLLEGRPFTERDVMEIPPVVVINEILARRFWPEQNPLGRRLILGSTIGADQTPRTVVGVVGNVRSAGLESEPGPEIYVPYPQNPWPTMTAVIRATSDPIRLVGAVRKEILALDPDQPVYNVRPLEEVLGASLAARRFQMLLLGIFAAVALIMAAIGVYAVMAEVVTQRTHEIGIRMALGARPHDVLKLVVGRGIRMSLAGVAVGLAGALALTRWMSSLLFGVSPTDPMTFTLISLILTGVALLACYIPARRASRLDPIVAVRYE